MKQHVLRLETGPLSPESALVAEAELRETPERMKESLAALRRMLASKNTLQFPDSDEFLVRFLRPTKFYPESAVKMMEEAAHFKKKYSDVVGNLMPVDEEKTLCEHDIMNALADRDQHGRRILLFNVGEKWDPSSVTALQIFRCLYLFHVAACLEPETQVNGVVVIVNMEGFGVRQAMKVCPSQAKMRFTFYQKAMPLRLKQIHIVNEPLIFSAVMRIVKPFMQDKLRNRFFCHGKDMSSLHRFIDPCCLPEDLGGTISRMEYTSKDWFPEMKRVEPSMTEWHTFALATDLKEEIEK